jgi:hypothetical protein
MSCLFNSLSYFFNEKSYDIRQKICDYLKQNNPIIDGLDTLFILNLENPNYIEHMRKTSTWGGAIEIQCACNIWKSKIIVKDVRRGRHKNIEFLPLHNEIEKTIHLEWSGGHYEPVRR